MKHSALIAALMPNALTLAAVVEIPLIRSRFFHYMNVTVGTPDQTISCAVDTGSPWTWVLAEDFSPLPDTTEEDLTDKCNMFDLPCDHTFNTSASTSLTKYGDDVFEVTYGAGSVRGDYALEQLQISTAGLDNFTLALVMQGTVKMSGLLGLSLPFSSQSTSPESSSILNSMVKQDIIESPSFAIWTDHGHEKPSMTFGGFDRSKYVGRLLRVPLQPRKEEWGTDYVVNVTSFALTFPNGSTIPLTPPTFNMRAVLDSGSYNNTLPRVMADQLEIALAPLGFHDGLAPCSIRNQTGGVDLAFYTGGYNTTESEPRRRLTYRHMFSEALDDDEQPLLDPLGQPLCRLNVVGTGFNEMLLSQGFYRSIYTVHHQDKKVLGLGQAVDHAHGPSDLVPITSGDPYWAAP